MRLQRSWLIALAVVVVAIIGVVLWRQSQQPEQAPPVASVASAPSATASVANRTAPGPYEAERAQAKAAADQKLDAEAVAVVAETDAAIRDIMAGDRSAALAALERATGKANILLARNPATAAGMSAVEVEVVDAAPADAEAIAKIRRAADVAMLARDYAGARALLEALRSEIRVRTYNLPLATYPAALTTAARLLDQQRMQEAAAALARARDTVVVVDAATPIPLLAAQHALAAAEKSPDPNQKLAGLDAARAMLERAEALGYADPATRKAMLADIRNLEAQVKGGSDIRTAIATFQQRLGETIRRLTETKKEGRA